MSFKLWLSLPIETQNTQLEQVSMCFLDVYGAGSSASMQMKSVYTLFLDSTEFATCDDLRNPIFGKRTTYFL